MPGWWREVPGLTGWGVGVPEEVVGTMVVEGERRRRDWFPSPRLPRQAPPPSPRVYIPLGAPETNFIECAADQFGPMIKLPLLVWRPCCRRCVPRRLTLCCCCCCCRGSAVAAPHSPLSSTDFQHRPAAAQSCEQPTPWPAVPAAALPPAPPPSVAAEVTNFNKAITGGRRRRRQRRRQR